MLFFLIYLLSIFNKLNQFLMTILGQFNSVNKTKSGNGTGVPPLAG